MARDIRRAAWKLAAVALALSLILFCRRSGDTTSADVTTNSIPAAVLQLFQNEANSPPWNQDTSAKTQGILQQCATLQQLLTSGADDTTLSNTLAASTLRASVFMTFGQSLYNSADPHHAEMFFASLVRDHPARATVKQLGRCHLWIARIHKDQALALQYQQQSPDLAAPEFQAALASFLAARNVSATNDWVRGSGWLGAAACYRELGDQENRRTCLYGLLADTSIVITNPSSPDVQLVAAQRDVANYLMAVSYYEEHRYAEATQLYQQMQQRLTAQLATGSPQYSNQQQYLALANTGLSQCAARQAEQAAQTGGAQ
ncbi:MAG TPA: hypothetical protein VMP11_16310 [Verrucomicrobiae bacterium]|nr:hypothetical protein [Verrucomicrobiae bacterium]